MSLSLLLCACGEPSACDAEQPIAIETPFRIASMTKPRTAVAALILVEEDRLGLDNPDATLTS